MSERNLYGRREAERLYFSAVECYEADSDYDTRSPFVMEEWSSCPVAYHLPRACDLIDRIVEDVDEWDDDGLDEWGTAGNAPDVQAAFQAALDLLGSKITCRMVDEKLRDLVVTFDDEGRPFLDGEPMYAPVAS